MEDELKKRCPNCKQFYRIKSSDYDLPRNLPLFLSCGHSICETCVGNIENCNTPIDCQVCHGPTYLSEMGFNKVLSKEIPIYDIFPVNTYTIGEIALQTNEDNHPNVNSTVNNCYTNIVALLLSADNNNGACVECGKTTLTMCEQCDFIVCKRCFDINHKVINAFQNHALISIGDKLKRNCKFHTNRQLDYFCTDCCKSICVNCLMMNGRNPCHRHYIRSMRDVNQHFLADLLSIEPRVDETFRRLTKTVVDIGNALRALGDDTSNSAYSTVMNKINEHFLKFNYILQKENIIITRGLLNMQTLEIDFLKYSKNGIAENIKKARTISKTIRSLEPDKLKGEHLSCLLEEAKKMLTVPWRLKLRHAGSNVQLNINETMYTSLNDNIQIDANEACGFGLFNTQEMIQANEDIPEAPTIIFYPSELFQGNNMPLHMPYPVTHQYEYLVEGWRDSVYVSHIEDPHNFYVQLVSDRVNLQELAREFDTMAAYYGHPHEKLISEGKFQLVYNKVDKIWQRCSVVSIDRSDVNTTIYHVFCVDYGHKDAVKIDDLRHLPMERMVSPQHFAIYCTLADCEPSNGSWRKADNVLMQDIIDNKPSVLQVERIDNMANGNIRVKCDLVSEDGVSVSHALAFHERARVPRNMPWAKHYIFSQRPTLFSDCQDYSDKIEDVIILNVVNSYEFYVRKLRLQPAYKKLCEDLEKDYDFNTKTDCVYLPEVSMACVAHIEGLNLGAKWARAVVMEMLEKRRVRVTLPDIGAKVLLDWSDLRRIHMKYTVQLGYAYLCNLHNLKPRYKRWSSESTAYLQSFQDKPLEMHIEDHSQSITMDVILYDKSNKLDVICINDQMLKYNYALPISPLELKNEDELALTNPMPSENEVSNPVLMEIEAKVKEPLRHQVKVLNYESPSIIYISKNCEQMLFEELNETLHNYYSNMKVQPNTHWRVGDSCCTLWNLTQTWVRAEILELENENAKVFYTDFTFTETVPILSLREMMPWFSSVDNTAIMCHLNGVKPTVGDEWSSLAKDCLKGLLDSYKKIFISKVAKFKGQSMPIELWVRHTIESGGTETNGPEWLSLNQKIIEFGLAIPDKDVTSY